MKEDKIFKVTLGSRWKENTTLLDAVNKEVFIIISEPKFVYSKWYHKILNKITLGYRFKEGWKHSVEKISK